MKLKNEVLLISTTHRIVHCEVDSLKYPGVALTDFSNNFNHVSLSP